VGFPPVPTRPGDVGPGDPSKRVAGPVATVYDSNTCSTLVVHGLSVRHVHQVFPRPSAARFLGKGSIMLPRVRTSGTTARHGSLRHE